MRMAEYLCGCAQHTCTLCGCTHSLLRRWGRLFHRECVASVCVGKYQVCGVRKFVKLTHCSIFDKRLSNAIDLGENFHKNSIFLAKIDKNLDFFGSYIYEVDLVQNFRSY